MMLAMQKIILFCLMPFMLSAFSCAQQTDTAIVHFYRYKQMQGALLKPSVYCDGQELGRMQDGRVFDVRVAPGPHTFYANDKQAGASVNLEPGKEYYFRTDLQLGFWKGHFRLTMVMPEQGKYDVANLKPADPDNVLHDKFPVQAP
jgi:hypothetical protein